MAGGSSASSRSAAVHAAAELLAAVYRKLAENGVPLDNWATTTHFQVKAGKIHNLNHYILMALMDVKDVEWKGHDDIYSREEQYIDSYKTIIDEVRKAAIESALEMFHRQALALGDFDRRLAREGIADHLSEIADRVRHRVDGFVPSAPDTQRAEEIAGPPETYDSTTGMHVPNPGYWKALPKAFEARVRQELAATLKEYGSEVMALRSRPTPTGQPSADKNVLRHDAVDICKVLSLHPELVKILDYYAQDAGLGGRLAHRLVLDAIEAGAKFIGEITHSDNMVWRFPPLVVLGVKRLQLQDIEGFPEYAVDIGLILGRDWVDSALAAVGIAVFLLGLLLTGPAATGVLLLDVALTDASLALTYFREREQDLLAVSGGYSSKRLVERSDYSGTKLAAIGALLVGIALVFQGAKLLKSWRERKLGSVRGPTEPPTPPGAAARQRVRQPKLPSARATEGKALNPAIGSSARYRGEEWQPPKRPRWDESPRPQYQRARASATGTYGDGEMPSVAAGKSPDSGEPKASRSTGSKIKGSDSQGSGGLRPGSKPKRRSLKGTKPKPKLLSDAEAERLQAKYKDRAGRWYPPEEWAYIEKLEQRYPALERARLRPEESKQIGTEFMFEERMGTSQGRYSLRGYNDRGEFIIEIDGISVDGWVEEIKIEQTDVQKCVYAIRQKADFAEAFGLKGVQWSIAPPSIADEVELLLSNGVVKNAYRVPR